MPFLNRRRSHFSNYRLPVRDLGGITRANVDAVMHLERTTPTHVRLALDVTRDLPDAHVTINGATLAFDGRVSLSPRETWRWEGDDPSGKTPLQPDVTDANGQPVISHTENHFTARQQPRSRPGHSRAAASGRPARRR